MFLADDENWESLTTAMIRKAESLNCQVYLNTECGHSTYAVLEGVRRFKIDTNLEVAPIVRYYAQWIREGKLRVSSDWNKDRQIKFTVQDPCNQVRKGYGDELAEDLRFVVKSVVGEENFVDMIPNKSANFCCGGGGGYLQSGYQEERRRYGKVKFDQIMTTGASYCITPCHNCHAQIHDLSGFYKGNYHTVNLWTMIALSLGVLGANERRDLGSDLIDVNVPLEKEIDE